jgi:hypothetical protein
MRYLIKTCVSRRVLPRSHYFPGRLFKTGPRPLSGGGTADVWRVTDDRKNLYAAKVFRANHGEDHKVKVGPSPVKYGYATHFPTRGIIRKSRCGSGWTTPTWSQLSARGLDIAELCVVSPWMPDGDLLQYLSRYPGANRVCDCKGSCFSTLASTLSLIPIRWSELRMGFPISITTTSFTEV